jgi:hypothetical protein
MLNSLYYQIVRREWRGFASAAIQRPADPRRVSFWYEFVFFELDLGSSHETLDCSSVVLSISYTEVAAKRISAEMFD